MPLKGRQNIVWTAAEDKAAAELRAKGLTDSDAAVEMAKRFPHRVWSRTCIAQRRTAVQEGKRLGRQDRPKGASVFYGHAAPPDEPLVCEVCGIAIRDRQTVTRTASGVRCPAGTVACKPREAAVDIPIYVEADEGGYMPRPQRGPMLAPHYVPEGHELAGISRLKDAAGAVVQEWDKTRVAGADEPPAPIPESFLIDRASVMRRGDGSTVVEWSSYRQAEANRWEDIKRAVADHVAEYVRPVAPTAAPRTLSNDLLVAYPLGDPHIGMLAWGREVGENFDLATAQRELCECIRQLVMRSPPSTEAVICNLGDFWHAQDDNQRTPTSGHKLDVDGRAGKVGRVGLAICRQLVDTALCRHARVRFRSIPGNHDPHGSFWLPEYLRAVYANEPRVVVEDGFNPYQYDAFGKVLLGWAHGDGAKIDALGEVMATDVPEMWGAASFRYWNTGHVHHWSQKELRGCVVDTHRTLAGRDAWTHHSGYRSGRALKAIAYHREYGLDSVAIVGIERVRAALKVEGPDVALG